MIMCEIHVNDEAKIDPTRTRTLRERFMRDANKRFRKVRGRIRDKVVEDDGFGLKANRGDFEFARSSEKIAAFMDWLEGVQREEVLGVMQGTPIRRAGAEAWTSTYVQSAYAAGVRQAANRMKGKGADVSDRWIDASFNRPIHADRLGVADTRAFTELRGITEAMDQQISRELAQGLGEGLNPLDIARRINDRVEKIGATRAKTLARTEVINAHAEATLNSYEEAGVEGVEVLAEFTTAGDSRVCPICEDLERRVAADGGWSLDRARGVIPVHPNCRCVWTPMVPDMRGVELR